MERKGFAFLPALLVVVGVIVVGGAAYFGYNVVRNGKYNNNSQPAATVTSTAQTSLADFKNLQDQCYQKIKNADKIVTIYFNNHSDFSKLQSIATDIKTSQSIKSVIAKSAADALQDLKQKHAGDQAFQNAVKDVNPTDAMLPYITVTLSVDQNQPSVTNYITQETQKYGASVDSSKPDGSLREGSTLEANPRPS